MHIRENISMIVSYLPLLCLELIGNVLQQSSNVDLVFL